MSGKQSFKFRWEAAIGRTCYVASVKQVARVLAHYADADGTNARPGIQRIMNETSLQESAVEKALRVLIEDGWTEKASRVGVKRSYFDSHNLLMPCWLLDLAPGRPDCRREFQRAVHAAKMKADREAKKAADQPYTSTPNPEINLADDASRLAVYTEPDHPYTYPGSPVYTERNVAGQSAPIPTNRPTLNTNHGAPGVADAQRASPAAAPHEPDGVDLASARSARNASDSAASPKRAAASRRTKPDEPFRKQTDEYTAAAKKLEWATVRDALAKWRRACGPQYAWARKTALASMGRRSESELVSERGFELADRRTYDKALRMHLADGNWHEALTAPFALRPPLAPSKINDAGDADRRRDLETYFQAIRLMTADEVAQFAFRLNRDGAEHVARATRDVEADLVGRPELSGETDRLVCMQFFNTTQGWPAWLTDPLRERVAAYDPWAA